MAIRVLTRPTLQLLNKSNFKSIPIFSNPQTQFYSSNPTSPISISPNSSHQSEYKKLISLTNIFQRYGFSQSQLHDFLTKNRFLLNSNSPEIEKSLKILLSFKLPQKFIVSMVEKCPHLLEFEFLRKWESAFSEMGMSSFTSLMVQNVLEVSRKFSLTQDDLSRCVQLLKSFGFSESTVIRVLQEIPMVIMMSESGISERIEFLGGIGIDRYEIDRIFNKFPRILILGVENKLNPLLDELKDLGFSRELIRNEILRDPRVLGLELGEFSRCLEMLRTLKCRVPIKEKIYRDGPFRACLAVKSRIDCLYRHGLIYRDAFKVMWKEPRAILYDIGDIEKKIDYLVNEMKFDVHWLVDVPEYLGVNFEKHIVPRHNVIEYLRSKGGLGDEVGLKAMINLSRLKFYNLYVKPYPECEKMFGRFSGDIEVKRPYPVGLWKLFKPKIYSDSKEDVKSIKSFMESLV